MKKLEDIIEKHIEALQGDLVEGILKDNPLVALFEEQFVNEPVERLYKHLKENMSGERVALTAMFLFQMAYSDGLIKNEVTHIKDCEDETKEFGEGKKYDFSMDGDFNPSMSCMIFEDDHNFEDADECDFTVMSFYASD